MWFDIIKNLKGKAKSKGKTLDTSDFKIDIEDNDCNKQLQEWARKLKNYSLLLQERYYDNELMVKHFEVGEDSNYNWAKEFTLYQKPTSQKYLYSRKPYLEEGTYFTYEPVPENIACKAIDMLKKSTTGDRGYDLHGATETAKIGKYEIRVFNYHEYQHNMTGITITIPKEEKLFVNIAWFNGEDINSGEDTFDKDFPIESGKTVFDISGYYEARKFGYSWWK